MRLLIINTLPKDHPAAEKAICCLTEKASECTTFYTEDMRITPCIGCNACWLKTPGICAVKDDYEQILKAYLQYDVTLFISDTALGFVDYKMKHVIDRILPMATMYTTGVFSEEFLKTLPAQLGCGYGGTFIKGDMFGLSLMRVS